MRFTVILGQLSDRYLQFDVETTNVIFQCSHQSKHVIILRYGGLSFCDLPLHVISHEVFNFRLEVSDEDVHRSLSKYMLCVYILC